MKLGIVGLPNVGKSTLFNAITNAGAQAANYPFCTIEPNVGTVAVPDKRLEVLKDMYNTKRVVPAVIEFVDIAGLVKGASRGEGLGNKFLSHIREVDSIVHVVRCFYDENITHVDGEINPLRDLETINFELIFADIEAVERRIERARKSAKADKKFAADEAFFEGVKQKLIDGVPARKIECTEDERLLIKEANLLTAKPVVYAANMSEEDFAKGIEGNAFFKQLAEFSAAEGAQILPICAKIEEELSSLDDEEKMMFLEELNLEQSGLDRLVSVCYKLLGLISYLTAGVQEVRAWTIERGTIAQKAAGKIHTDFERGFIRAEVIAYDNLVEVGGLTAAKEKGLVRSEGKEYIMQDGDVVLFRINV